MKTPLKSVVLMAVVLLPIISEALPISYVNLTALSTNTTTNTGIITVTGTTTNVPYSLFYTNFNFGDLFPTAFNKLNADIFALYNWDLTNTFGFGWATNVAMGGVLSGPSSNTIFSAAGTNAIQSIAGGGTGSTNITLTGVVNGPSTNNYFSAAGTNAINSLINSNRFIP